MEHQLVSKVKEAVNELYKVELPSVELQPTRKDFEGDLTLVVFPMLRYLKGNPEKIGSDIGEYLLKNVPDISAYNVIKGFLNLTFSDSYFLNVFNEILTE
ncbi:MAG: arginine--tRNA ligase, partial [Flavobacteriaceae bacterium]|nr:arginine--tRNA ligase [Flavobacteriaceae bacterium]